MFNKLAENALIYFTRAMLMQIAAFCTLGTVISAFSLPLSMPALFFILLAATLIITAVTEKYREQGVLYSTIVLVVLFIVFFARIVDDFVWVVHNISARYHQWLPVPVMFEYASEYIREPIYFFSCVGVIILLLLSLTVCIRRSLLLTMLSTLPVILTAFVLNNTHAGYIYLLGVLSVYLTILISNSIYPDDLRKNALVLMPSFMISALLLGSLYLITPPSSYERTEHADNFRQSLLDVAERIVDVSSGVQRQSAGNNDWLQQSDPTVRSFNTARINVADAGMRSPSDTVLLQFQSSQSGTFYLRGFSMSYFGGRTWYPGDIQSREFELISMQQPSSVLTAFMQLHSENATLSPESAALSPESAAAPVAAAAIVNRVLDVTNVEYIPYYQGNSYSDAAVNLEHSWYNISFIYIPDDIHNYMTQPVRQVVPPVSSRISDYNAAIEPYLQIEPDTARQLRNLALEAGIDRTMVREDVVSAVAEYIRQTGRYALNPAVTPQNEDFALYFLQVSKEGYCIHYATAATLMLRALGIPSRFVSGFIVDVPAGGGNFAVDVKDSNAHAWVEVLYDDAGWVPVEVTASGRGSPVPSRQDASQPVQYPTEPATEPVTVPVSPPPPPTPFDITSPPSPPSTDPDPDIISSAPPGGNNPNNPDTSSDSGGSGTGSGGSGSGGIGALPEKALLSPPVAGLLISICFVITLCAVLIMRSGALTSSRRKRFYQSNTNAAVISMWRYIRRLNHNYEAVPEDIQELALKARFSQHVITPQERIAMYKYVKQLSNDAYLSKNAFGRLWFKYILALGMKG